MQFGITRKVLKTEALHSKRLASEAWFINSHPHVMNRSHGDSLLQVYRRLLWFNHLVGRNYCNFLLCTF